MCWTRPRTALHVFLLACQDRMPYAEPVDGGIEDGGGWSSIRFDQGRVDSSRVVSRPCGCCVVSVCGGCCLLLLLLFCSG